jgi:hypothetical protein
MWSRSTFTARNVPDHKNTKPEEGLIEPVQFLLRRKCGAQTQRGSVRRAVPYCSLMHRHRHLAALCTGTLQPYAQAQAPCSLILCTGTLQPYAQAQGPCSLMHRHRDLAALRTITGTLQPYAQAQGPCSLMHNHRDLKRTGNATLSSCLPNDAVTIDTTWRRLQAGYCGAVGRMSTGRGNRHSERKPSLVPLDLLNL